MSRWYEVTFVESGTGRSWCFTTSGNTRRSAERHARAFKLKPKVGDTSKWYAHRIVPTKDPYKAKECVHGIAYTDKRAVDGIHGGCAPKGSV